MKRAYDLEIIDRPVEGVAEYEQSLAQVADVNRLLGGDRALRMSLAPLLEPPEPMRLLDVGAGSGAVALGVARWAARHGRRWSICALDFSPQAAVLARRTVSVDRSGAPVSVVRANGLRLPFADQSFDAAYTVLTLHHFDDDLAVALLREMARVVRRLVVVNDLERSRPAWLGARLLAASVWRGNRITRNDGPLSVRRAFTPGELLEIGRRARLERATVRRRLAFRLVLEGTPTGDRP
ncbi:MAG: methyltransferase domain-containing protein [Gemmatimonadetes bacterium]|nr:methyltransferase domain-containing protein [Gemmatimonadota bacterium]